MTKVLLEQPRARAAAAAPSPPAPPPEPSGPSPGFSVHGPDGRKPVADFAAAPWICVCRVEAHGTAGVSRGTAFLITQRWALTAAHVVQDAGAPRRIDVHLPEGKQSRAQFLPYRDYAGPGDKGRDIGLLRLDSPSSKPVDGMMEARAFDDAFLARYRDSRALAEVPGYPIDHWPAMMKGAGEITGFSKNVIEHVVDTRKRQSGAPLLYRAQAGCWVLGVHGHGDVQDRDPPQTPNLAARLNAAALAWIDDVFTQYGR